MMMRKRQRRRWDLALTVALLCLTAGAIDRAHAQTEVPPALKNPSMLEKLENLGEYDRLIRFIRRAGLEKQRSQVRTLITVLHPDLLQAAQNVPDVRRGRFYLQVATLLALARIGDSTALSPLREAESHLDPYFQKELLPVVVARIQAESRYPNPRTPADWQKKVRYFLKQADVSMDEVPLALEEYYDRSRRLPVDNMLYAPRAIWAMRQLAEMAGDAYANGVKDTFQVFQPITAHLEEKDYILWLRIQLGHLDPQARIHWLVDQLAGKGVERTEESYLENAVVLISPSSFHFVVGIGYPMGETIAPSGEPFYGVGYIALSGW
ncbi:MAG: hypothetical protein ACUVV1_03460 [Fimbriimonadales bacterium]